MKYFERFEVEVVTIFWLEEEGSGTIKNPNQNPIVLYKEMKHQKNPVCFFKSAKYAASYENIKIVHV